MALYLVQASYTTEGIKGLLQEGGTSRRQVIDELVGSLGGSVEAAYFAFGEHDVYVIAELPENADAAALSMTVGASGAVRTKTTVLLTPEEVDEASKKSPTYRPPGG